MIVTAGSRLVAGLVVLVLAVGLITIVPVESGPLALAGLLWPLAALAAVAAGIPAVATRRTRVAAPAVALLLVLMAFRLGGEWLSLPPGAQDPAWPRLQVVSWNIEIGNDPAATIEGLAAHPADLVALQELTPAVADAIEADLRLTERYPFRALAAAPGVAGMGILSRLPLDGVSTGRDPFRQWATFVLDGQRIEVANAHPLPGRIARGPFGWPVSFNPAVRNDQLARLRTEIDERLAAGARVVVIGDLNAAPTEPAFGRMTDGLADVHADVGQGPGWTYRPSRFEALGIGLLRIDVVLGGPGVVPVSIRTDCRLPGDHCLVEAVVAIEPG